MVLRHLLFWLLLTITLYFFIVLVFPLEIPQIMAVLNPPSLSTWRDVENISESTPRTRRHIAGIRKAVFRWLRISLLVWCFLPAKLTGSRDRSVGRKKSKVKSPPPTHTQRESTTFFTAAELTFFVHKFSDFYGG